MRTVLLAGIAISVIVFSGSRAAEEETKVDIWVENEPVRLDTDKSAITATVFGFRPIGDADLVSLDQVSRLRFSRETILKAALQFEEIKQQMRKNGLRAEDVTLMELKEAVKDSGYGDKYLYSHGNSKLKQFASYKEKGFIEAEPQSFPIYRKWDPTLIVNMVATGVIDVETVSYKSLGGKLVELVGFDGVYKKPIHAMYEKLPQIKGKQLQNIPVSWSNLSDSVKSYTPLETALLLRIGDITFGKPEIYSAKEKKLKVPAATQRIYDVYWVELKVTFWDLKESDLSEMAVNFAIPNDTRALHLVPLNYGIPVAVQENLQTPILGVEAKGVKAAVGEIYKRTVGYTYLKPVVTAFGEGEDRFAWKVTEEAVRAGSHRFVAVLGVPKGTRGIGIAMSGHVRVDKIELFGGGLAGTDPVTFYLNF